ncbi:glycoside hydrolase family 73 protein [Trinickia mobilis]|uniref:glycoside hydrolase family 73 protein n=1 Tax=Trinickia mobilis TaxID=2816356 RepID=UPI001A8CD6A2|nr:glucosaminidase domain-containing protein [Trinickia mobilis]
MFRTEMSGVPAAGNVFDAASGFAAPQPNGAPGAGSFSMSVQQLQSDIEGTVKNGFQSGATETAVTETAATAWMLNNPLQAQAATQGRSAPVGDKASFVDRVSPWAKLAAQKLGVAPDLLVAHAALESDWGRRPVRDAKGNDTHNLFGLKAGSSWDGKTADITTTEYVKGAGIKTIERFRAYADDQSAFADYVNLLQTNPRFSRAQGTGSDAAAFAKALARGGYATDPVYTHKLTRVVADVKAQTAAFAREKLPAALSAVSADD